MLCLTLNDNNDFTDIHYIFFMKCILQMYLYYSRHDIAEILLKLALNINQS